MTQDAERLEIVSDGERLKSIASEWEALRAHSGGLVFQSHGWISAWWHTLPAPSRYKLRIALAWQGDKLAAVLPLVIVRRRGVRVLEWAAKDVSDYCDAIAGMGDVAGILRRMWVHICAGAGFDMVYLSHVLPDAKAHALLGSLPHAVRLSLGHRTENSLRVTGTWPDGQAWFDKLPKKVRQNYRRGQKILSEKDLHSFRLLRPEERGPVVELLAAQKRLWLAANGQRHPLFDEGNPLLPALTGALADQGVLRIFVIECGLSIVAITINFVQGDTMMAFLTSYDPDYERGSPGMVLIMDYVQWSIGNGLKCVDLLCGAESFKFRLTNESVTLRSFVGSRSLVGLAAVTIDRSGNALKAAAKRIDRTPARSGKDEA